MTILVKMLQMIKLAGRSSMPLIHNIRNISGFCSMQVPCTCFMVNWINNWG